MVVLKEEMIAFRGKWLADLLGVSLTKLRTLEKNKVIPLIRSSGNRRLYTADEMRLIISSLKVNVERHYIRQRYFRELMACRLHKCNKGIFLWDRQGNRRAPFARMVKKYGLHQAEGLNNHVHLDRISGNHYVQYVAAHEIISHWMKVIEHEYGNIQFVVYLTFGYTYGASGAGRNLIVCLYVYDKHDIYFEKMEEGLAKDIYGRNRAGFTLNTLRMKKHDYSPHAP